MERFRLPPTSSRTARGRGVLLALTGLALAGCHTMRPLSLDQLNAARPTQVWVTRSDQSVVLLTDPQVVNDRLAGFQDDVYQVIPAGDVQQIATRNVALGRTTALVAGGAAGAVALMWVLSGTDDYQHPCDRGTDECDPGEVP